VQKGALLEFETIHQPDLPYLNGIGFLQGGAYVFYDLICTAVRAVPFKGYAVFFAGVVLDVAEGCQNIVIVRAAIVCCS